MHAIYLQILGLPHETQVIGLILILMTLLLIEKYRIGKNFREDMEKRSTMVALLSHRLRTPLGAIRWSSEMLLDTECGTLQPEQKELVDKMNASIIDAISVLDTFLGASRFERGEFSYKPQKVDVWQVIMNVVQSMQSQIQKKGIIVDVQQSFAHTFIYCDPILIHTLFDVTISNAVHYTPWKGRISVSAKEENGVMNVDVSDSGLGIAPEDQKHIFERFYRTAEARKIDPNGNGLGLTLARDILRTIGGSISFTSVKGQGTTFTIKIPKGDVKNLTKLETVI